MSKLDTSNSEYFRIKLLAQRENLSPTDVKTILRIALITDKANNIREKYLDTSLVELWNNIPNKGLCLTLYKEQKKRGRRKRNRLI